MGIFIRLERLFIFKLCRGYLNVLGNVYQNRSGTSRFCYPESFSQRIRKLVYVLYNIIVLCYRQGNSADINLLKAVSAQQTARNVAGYCDYRNRIQISGRYSGYKVCGSRTGRCKNDACFPVDLA